MRKIIVDKQVRRIYEFNKRKGMTDEDLKKAMLTVLGISQAPPKRPSSQPTKSSLP